MKQNVTILRLGAIALTGLLSCTTTTSTRPTTQKTMAIATSTQTAISVGGSSSTQDFLQTLVTAYQSSTQTTQINQLEPGQSENIITGIQQKIIDLGAISKPLKPEENDGSLEFRQVAKDALLVATHPSVTGVSNLTTEDLKAIYSGSVTNWKQLGGPDAKIVVFDRPEDESAKRLLREHYLGTDLKSSPEAVIFRKEGELIQALQSTPYSIGAFSLAFAISHNLPVNRLSLNSVEPNVNTVKTGQYPMVRTIGMIWHKNPSESTQALIQYIVSPAGISVLEGSGFVPITPATEMPKS